jgi:AcrR family transcriptional regulator
MARKKNFDPTAVLIQAVELFWRKGYAHTSLSDLVEHLQVNRFSLYSTFGDKRNLYLQSLNYYIDNYSLPALQTLLSDEACLSDLKSYFLYFSELQYQQTSGCFVQNAILELSLSDPKVGEAGDRLYLLVERAFLNVLMKAKHSGEISQNIDIETISHFLLLQSQGIRVMGKAKQYKVMENAMTIILSYIESLKEVTVK